MYVTYVSATGCRYTSPLRTIKTVSRINPFRRSFSDHELYSLPIEIQHNSCSDLRKSLNLRIYDFLHIVIAILVIFLLVYISGVNITD